MRKGTMDEGGGGREGEGSEIGRKSWTSFMDGLIFIPFYKSSNTV